SVRYLGEKSLEEIVAAIDDSDVGIVPNRRGPFSDMATPTRIFEYLARGKPVITTRARGVRDYFAEDALVFCEPDDTGDLARAVTCVFESPEETERVVRRGQEVYLAHRWSEERRGLVACAAELFDVAA